MKNENTFTKNWWKDIINEVRKREHFTKTSTSKKLAKETARKKEQKRQEEQDVKRMPV